MNLVKVLFCYSCLVILPFLVSAKENDLQRTKRNGINLSNYNLNLLYENTFDNSQLIEREEDMIKDEMGTYMRMRMPVADAEWIAEGWGDVKIANGKLWVAPVKLDSLLRPVPADSLNPVEPSHMVVWNNTTFPANFLLSFTVNHHGSDNGLTLLFFNCSGADGKDMFGYDMPVRRANYRSYHAGGLVNYSDSYWSRNKKPEGEKLSNRLRKNPGMAILASGKSRTKRSSRKDYRVRILKFGGRITIEINNRIVVEGYDKNPLGEGRIGLRCMKGVAKVSYDDFKVYGLDNR